MSRSPGPRGDDVPVCTATIDGHYCGKRHLTRTGLQACTSHVRYDRDSYVKGQDRKKLPEPRPCAARPRNGATICKDHGGRAVQVESKAAQRVAEAKARRALGDAGEPVADPIGKLCAIAGRAVAFMESLAQRVDDLDGAASDEQRAEIVVYGRSIRDAAAVVESIIRMGIAERLAKADEQLTASVVAFIDGVLADLGHNPRDPQVAGVVARRLELVS